MIMTGEEIIEVIQALLDGKKVEFSWPYDTSFSTSTNPLESILSNITIGCVYRVKPEPEVVYRMVIGADGQDISSRTLYSKTEADLLCAYYPKRKFKKFISVD